MKPSASQILQARRNHQWPARTLDSRIKATLAHMQASIDLEVLVAESDTLHEHIKSF